MTPEPTEAEWLRDLAVRLSDYGDLHSANRLERIASAMEAAREPEAGKLREALEQIAQHDIGEDLGTSECDNCHDKGFEHYWAVKKIARTALSHNQGDGR